MSLRPTATDSFFDSKAPLDGAASPVSETRALSETVFTPDSFCPGSIESASVNAKLIGNVLIGMRRAARGAPACPSARAMTKMKPDLGTLAAKW